MICEVHSLSGSLSPGLEHHILSGIWIEPKIHPEKKKLEWRRVRKLEQGWVKRYLSVQARRRLVGGPQRSSNISIGKREETVLPEDRTSVWCP